MDLRDAQSSPSRDGACRSVVNGTVNGGRASGADRDAERILSSGASRAASG